MKALIGISVALLLAASAATYPVVAQAQGATTLNGCLESTDGKYFLNKATGADSVKGKRVALTPGEKIDMKAHVGHTVEVSGDLTGADTATPTMKVTAFKHVSPSCS